jgi:membrane protease YdiL (CAAX protease family)
MPDDQPPLVWLALLALTAAFGAIALLGPYVWYTVFTRLVRREPVLEHEPRRLASWGFIDLFIFLLVLFVAMAVLMLAFRAALGAPLETAAIGDDDNRTRLYLMLISAVGQLIAAGLTAAFILLRTGCNWRDLGLSREDFVRDVRLGATAFCALAIPTFVIQGILTRFWPSVHPLIESLKVDKDPQFLAIGLFAAVIAAPLTEEFAFRVLFQGWLEKMFDPAAIFRPGFAQSLFIGQSLRTPQYVPIEVELIQAELARPEEPRSIYLGPPPPEEPPRLNPYVAPRALSSDPDDQTIVPPNFPAWLTDIVPITATAALFAVMHIAHGPDFIPLFVLALGLGYLYRRTHRITPSLVVHFLLNLMSMTMLCVTIYGNGFEQLEPEEVAPEALIWVIIRFAASLLCPPT